MLWFWRNFHHWLHRKLSEWQLPVQPMMKISSKWHFRVSVRDVTSVFSFRYCIYRKYKHPYNYGKSTAAPLKARSTSIRSMVSQNGGPGSTASTTNTYRPPTKRSSRLSLYAEPQGPRYTSGLIPQKSEDSLYSTMPRGNPYSTMPRLYDKRNEDRQSAIFWFFFFFSILFSH